MRVGWAAASSRRMTSSHAERPPPHAGPTTARSCRDRVNKKGPPLIERSGPQRTRTTTKPYQLINPVFAYQKLKSATRRLTMTCALVASVAAFAVIAVAAA